MAHGRHHDAGPGAAFRLQSESDIDEFADTLAKFERGEIAPDQWRASGSCEARTGSGNPTTRR